MNDDDTRQSGLSYFESSCSNCIRYNNMTQLLFILKVAGFCGKVVSPVSLQSDAGPGYGEYHVCHTMILSWPLDVSFIIFSIAWTVSESSYA